jgi:HEAT repeat protein
MWTPRQGTRELVRDLGEDEALAVLRRMLSPWLDRSLYARDPFRRVLIHIGNGHAERLLADESGVRLDYWPRSWAARALAYLSREDAGSCLIEALGDRHWRVRMTAAQSLGRLGVDGIEEALAAALSDEHERVRSAAAVALGRTGNEFAIEPLMKALDDESEAVRTHADRAMARVERRLIRSS